MKKRYFYIIIVIIFILLIGFSLAWYILSQKGGINPNGSPKNPFVNLFPFGQDITTTVNQNGTPTGDTSTTTEQISQDINNPLRQISKNPTAGSFSSLKLKEVYVDYVEKETGNIFETKLSDMTQSRISNATIPRIHEVLFGNTGKTAILRYSEEEGGKDTIFSFALNVKSPTIPNNSVITDASSTPTTRPNGVFLTRNIIDPIISRDGNNMFFFTKTENFANRKTTGILYNFLKGTYTEVFSSQFSEWLPVLFTGNTVILQTKSSQQIPGFLYALDIKTSNFSRILGGINGLTTLPSPNGEKILYSKSTGGSLSLSVYDRSNDSTLQISTPTLPEKCVWTNDNSTLYCATPRLFPFGNYPDIWYQGGVSFSDTISKINTKTGEINSVFTPESLSSQSMDITDIKLSPDERYLIFKNKKDTSLWMYSLGIIE